MSPCLTAYLFSPVLPNVNPPVALRCLLSLWSVLSSPLCFCLFYTLVLFPLYLNCTRVLWLSEVLLWACTTPFPSGCFCSYWVLHDPGVSVVGLTRSSSSSHIVLHTGLVELCWGAAWWPPAWGRKLDLAFGLGGLASRFSELNWKSSGNITQMRDNQAWALS